MIGSFRGILVPFMFLLIFTDAVTISSDTYLGGISFSTPLTIDESHFFGVGKRKLLQFHQGLVHERFTFRRRFKFIW